MTLAFIIAAVLAGIFFLLWEGGREKLIEADGNIAQLKNKIEELANDPSRAVYGRQTKLTPELIDDVVRNNGFFPIKSEADWVGFKWQGEQFFISCDTLPGVQFYKGFSYGDDSNLTLLKEAAVKAMEETWYGHIAFSEGEKTISFRVFAIEKSVEHFTDSFMDYMNMLNHLIECHRYFYQKLEEENKNVALKEPQIESPRRENKVLS
jgi:hypothetical protein